MLLNRLPNYINRICLPYSNHTFYKFSRSDRTKRQAVSPQFSTMQHQKAQNYFDQYRQQVQNDSIISKFRKQIFTSASGSSPSELRSKSKLQNMLGQNQQQMNAKIAREQNYISDLLQKGKKQEIVSNAKKLMEGFKNNRGAFRGKNGKGGFKRYGDYTAYKENYVTIQDRNYLDGDRLDKTNTQRNTYKFLQSLPDGYQEKKEAIKSMETEFPIQSQNGGMSLAQYGKILQKRHQKIKNWQQMYSQKEEQKHYKMNLPQPTEQSPDSRSVFETLEGTMDLEQRSNFQLGTLSTQAMNKIYDLYLQGWSVREISKRFGILPMRTKFHIWSRARFFNQFLPKYGMKYLFASLMKQAQQSQHNYVVDYGLDLQQLTKTDVYQQITSWQTNRIDSQRKPQEYTQALQKLQKLHKFHKYDMLQVGTDGKQNKKHMLKEWKIHKGKGSDQYFLKNQHKVWRKFMYQNMKKHRAVYY